MKRVFVLLALLSIGLPSNSTVLAQRLGKTLLLNSRISKVSVKYAETRALSDGKGVWLEWRTESEIDNVGFYVYRISNGSRELVNPNPVPGSYLKMRNASTAGDNYSLFDVSGDLSSTYYIESLSISGQKRSSTYIVPQYVSDLEKFAGASSAALAERIQSANSQISQNENVLPKDLKAEVEANSLQADPNKQQWVAAQPGAKIGVKKEGIYKVSRAELEAGGFNVNTPTASWQLYKNGVEQAISVGANGDYIEFYGKGINTNDSDTQIYYLVSGSGAGQRIGTTFRRSAGGRVLTNSFDQTTIYRERSNYSTNIFNGETDNFFGRVISNNTTTIALNLPAIDPRQSTVSVDLTIQGLTLVSHQIRVMLNSVELGIVSGDYTASMNRRFEVPVSLLTSGTNSLQLATLAGTSDLCFFDTVKVRYNKGYQAQENQLSFYVPNYKESYIENFSSPNVRVFDVSNSDRPLLIDNLKIDQSGGSYRVNLPANRGRVVYAVENSAVLAPASIKPNAPSAIGNPANNGKLIIISYKDWMNEANDWANYRRAQGVSVDVVNIEDVYDEFSYGIVSSSAIKDFLKQAYSGRQTPPSYILLLGDATYDPRNYVGNGANNFVPTKMVETAYLETGSDDALVDFNDDGLAEIAIGRISAQNPQNVTTALNKVIGFEQTIGTQGLTRGALFASDVPDGYDFEGLSNRLRSELPPAIPTVMVNRGQPDARATLLNAINSGKFIVNYSGHGNTNIWATSGFFGQNDAAALTNTNLSIFTMLTCLNGYFIQPTDALAEVLMKRENGGAVASWASSSLTTPDIQEIMATRFFNQLGAANSMRLGDLIKDAKITIPAGRDVRLSWVLLGDPMLKVK